MFYHNVNTIHGVIPGGMAPSQVSGPIAVGGAFVAGRKGRTIGRFMANYNPGSVPSIGNASFNAVFGALTGTSNGMMYGRPSIHGMQRPYGSFR